jgi:NADH:ubiquinone oxidoreductase subunit 3 (subunit A)
MSLLVRLVELFILLAVVRVFLGVIFPIRFAKKPSSDKSSKVKRFDCSRADVSDGEYKEIK